MSRKKKVKLNKDQKKLLAHLEWYTKNRVNWVGDQDLREVVLDGHIAVFTIRNNPYKTYAEHWTFDCFDTVIMADSVNVAKAILRHNTPTYGLAVDLKLFRIISEVRNSWGPEFCFPDNLNE